ncbi:MAG: prepilin-type N-terminal cleavage/methylation domain-containing protein [Patescibacteria group bacterium]
MKVQRTKNSGFSLVELLITVSIIAILIAIGVASYATINRQSRDTKRKSDIEQIRSALEMYRADNGSYPSAGSGSWVAASSATDALIGLTPSLVSTYLSVVPRDPKSTQTYMYVASNPSGGAYYGYCLSVLLESENPTDTCTPSTGQTYGVKNP